MTNRNSSKDSLTDVNHNNYNAPAPGLLPHRRGMCFADATTTEDSNSNVIDLFSSNRRTLSVAASGASDLQVRLERLSVGSAKPAKNVLDDLLLSNEGGTHDYDWLLTPPGTPLLPSSDGKESQPKSVAPRSNSLIRAVSTNKTSSFESSHPSRPARSSSVARSSISTTTNYPSRNINILNTSSASVSSYIRLSAPTNRSSLTARSSTSSPRTTSRASTPSRTRLSPGSTSIDVTTRSSHNTKPYTPNSRPQTPGSLTSTTRPASRPSTPTRRSPTPSLSSSTTSSVSAECGARTVGSTSRPSSPSPRIRPPQQPRNLPDFSLDTPANLRTTLPNRPLSAGRSRPGAVGTVKRNPETTSTGGMVRRQSSPMVTRGRLMEPPERGHRHSNRHLVETLESQRTLRVPESLTRKPIKSSNSGAGTGFGRSITKKSLDVAIKHMDIRNGSMRQLSGSTLFPQSIRSGNSRTQAASAPGSVNGSISNGVGSNHNDYSGTYSSKQSSEVDIYESSRYDDILLNEDLKNTSWLHNADDNADQGSLFDNGFETLPEPFGPL